MTSDNYLIVMIHTVTQIEGVYMDQQLLQYSM